MTFAPFARLVVLFVMGMKIVLNVLLAAMDFFVDHIVQPSVRIMYVTGSRVSVQMDVLTAIIRHRKVHVNSARYDVQRVLVQIYVLSAKFIFTGVKNANLHATGVWCAAYRVGAPLAGLGTIEFTTM